LFALAIATMAGPLNPSGELPCRVSGVKLPRMVGPDKLAHGTWSHWHGITATSNNANAA
jgi:hypothetical protein